MEWYLKALNGYIYLAYAIITLTPLIGAVCLLVFLCEDSELKTNKWGPNPKGEFEGLTAFEQPDQVI